VSNEKQLRHVILDRLAPLHAIPVESPMEAGVPDINCVVGWIELKDLASWPSFDRTVVRPPHFRPVQRNWLATRCARGGAAWLLLRVADDVLLVWGTAAAKNIGVSWTKSELCRNTQEQVWWPRMPYAVELIAALTRRSWCSVD
jgi:hypothetical protein